VIFAMKDAEVDRQHGDDEEREAEPHPEHGKRPRPQRR
jgi:hypothetical protein